MRLVDEQQAIAEPAGGQSVTAEPVDEQRATGAQACGQYVTGERAGEQPVAAPLGLPVRSGPVTGGPARQGAWPKPCCRALTTASPRSAACSLPITLDT